MPKNFLWGAALNEYQNSGAINCPESNWAYWEQKKRKDGTSTIIGSQKSGLSTDFWKLYKKEIKLLKSIGINSLRFSISWDRIEPKKNKFDEKALEHYVNLCKELLDNSITPMATLHHFVHPQWFEEMGAFENEENLIFFIRFCEKVFEKLSKFIPLWCIINEPTIYIFQGYIRGVFPPGKKSLTLAIMVLKNLIQAHHKVYKRLKEMPNGNKVEIGFVHQYLKFEPYYWWNIIEYIPGFILNHILNDSIINFLKTGNFSIGIPYFCEQAYSIPQNEKIADFIGLNYYSRILIQFQLNLNNPLKASKHPGEIMTDMPYTIYPEGFYNALIDFGSLGIPIYVTENGIADKRDNKRQFFLKEYISALLQAIKDGADIRGYYYWTPFDNFEWNMGYTMKFGLFKVNFKTQERTLRKSSEFYKEIIKAAKK